MREPLILDQQQLVIEHHGRIAAVEVETRETRADVAELRAAIGEVSAGVGEIKGALASLAADVSPLVRASAAAHQQASQLLTYLFSTCLAIAGGMLSAWLSGLAHVSGTLQAASAIAAAIVCVLVARLALAHTHHR
jgi:hypothetical protein